MKVILTGVPKLPQGQSNTCWYAAACMVGMYFEYGPRLGIPRLIDANKAITPQEFITLAKNEHLDVVPVTSTWTSFSLGALLDQSGPVWAAGYWYGPGHVIVVTGVDNGRVHLNDPDGGVAKVERVSWFNQNLASSISGCMMVRAAALTRGLRPKTGWGSAPTSWHRT